MERYYPRLLEKSVRDSLERNPVTAILGPRQCGKSTLVKKLIEGRNDVTYLDLERPSDLAKLDDPEWFLRSQFGRLVCLDEIQRMPDLFPVLRSLVDENRKPGAYLLLGSASRDLIKQSSETLAGRISYKTLSPFLWEEVRAKVKPEDYLAKGGFPLSLLADSDEASYEWRIDFITTFLERDLLQFAGVSSTTMRRLWQMLAHSNGQALNLSKIGESLGVSHTTVRNYADLLEGTFMITQVRPWKGNTRKRLVKSPKIYLNDSGITSALLQLKNFEDISGHPVFSSLWESAVLMNIREQFPESELSWYRTNHGNEIDFLVSTRGRTVAVECKASVAPSLSKGFYKAAEDVEPHKIIVAAPVSDSYSMTEKVEVVSLKDLPGVIKNALIR